MMMNTQLTLKNYKLNITLGWTETERQAKQTIFLDLKIGFLEAPLATITDELTDTICYDELIKAIDEFCKNKSFKLIEYFAQELYEFLQHKMKTKVKLMLQVTKPHPCPNLEASVFTLGDDV